ncbi:filamentous hemagglutinin N-terminal domain-containing protein [Pseudanabaena sp. UWO311]|uniref:two-partner secretion domain-containing protein n=1 Tax=Pseudanabaena sp. UWO311 TaxID=2487337 RepID=UPI001157A0E1|nr:filamentous hemagglutinin N-terminal domain-containing protein [Pseudanabaena sp. UWO311]TYQ28627.1 filamentous hemagglutinin N-terminal domain-containing protein [Pseudanabaena sp. UWO311]
MKLPIRHICLSCTCALSYFSAAFSASAQIVPDATLPVNSTVTTTGLVHTINNGTTVGVNLYHSFQDFSVPTNNTAHFNNAAQVQNVLTRVTGNSVSNIDGLIKANGNANLYLLNPNGIAFGANAKLDIGGTFVGSTANSFKFTDGSEFSATNPQAPPLLTMTVTPGVQYSSANPAPITNAGNLIVGQDLTLSGGSVTSSGALSAPQGNILVEAIAGDIQIREAIAQTATFTASHNLQLTESQIGTYGDLNLIAKEAIIVRDSNTRPFVALSGGNLTVQGDRLIDIFALKHDLSGFYAGNNLLLRSENPVIGDAHYYTGGNFKIEQLNGRLGNLNSPNDPIVRSAGDVTFGIYVGSSLHVIAGGKINIDTIFITGTDTTNTTINPTRTPNLANVTLSNGKTLVINGSTKPTVDIRAGVNPANIGTSGIIGAISTNFFSCVFFGANCFYNNYPSPTLPPSTIQSNTGSGITIGDIRIDSPNGIVLLTNNYQPNLALARGDITITGTGGLGYTGIDVSSNISNGGSIFIDSRWNIKSDKIIDTSSTAPLGNGGSITLLANNNISFGNNAIITSSASNLSGEINLKANGAISGQGLSIDSTSTASAIAGNSGDINIAAASLSLQKSPINPSIIFSGTLGAAKAGNISLNITGSVMLDGFVNSAPTQIISQVAQNATGNGGLIKVYAGNLKLQNGAQINALTAGLGNSGDIEILANSINIDGIGSAINNQVFPTANANGGKITLNLDSLNVTNQGQISSTTFGRGNSGDLSIFATGDIIFDSSLANASINLGAIGKGGDIFLSANSLKLLNGGLLSSSVFGNGSGGKITVQADTVFLSGTGVIFGKPSQSAIATNVQTNAAIGNAGDINLSSRILHLSNRAYIEAATNGRGNSGDINIRASELVSAINNSTISNVIGNTGNGKGGSLNIFSPSITISDRSRVSAYTEGIGDSGNINFFTQSLSLSSNSALQAFTGGTGKAGNIAISPLKNFFNPNNVVKIERSSVSVGVERNGKGNAGNLSILATSLQLLDGAQIGANIFGQGDGGQIVIQADSITIDGLRSVSEQNFFSSIGTAVQTNAIGNAGTIDIKTRTLNLLNGAFITSESRGSGNAGKVEILASDSIFLNNGSVFSNVTSTSQGNGGDLKLFTNDFQMTNQSVLNASTASASKGGDIKVTANLLGISSGAKLITNTSSSGAAGNISLFLKDLLKVDGNDSGIFAGAEANSTGESGAIFIDPSFVTITNGAKISVSSLGKGDSGSIQIIAGLLSLDNKAQIIAETANGRGGNILLQMQDLLLLRKGSSISATAANDGNGGNINITAGFIVGVKGENSDIFANAFRGNGGNVNITTNGIYGLEFRPSLTTFSDITASSQFGLQGSVLVTTPGIDPSRGLTTLPLNLADPSKQVNQSCVIGGKLANRNNSFTISGKGGVPKSPSDGVSSTQSLVELSDPVASSISQATKTEQKPEMTPETPTRLVEANTIVRRNGNLELVSASAPLSPAIPQLACQ